MDRYLKIVEETLDEVLPKGRPEVLTEGMRYAVGAGGKRLRPIICLAAADAILSGKGGPKGAAPCKETGAAASAPPVHPARYPAAAIELLHNYTLVHDDLPAMDNDTVRRGKPSVWAKFGEANGILIGDALLSLAYEVAAKAPRNVPQIIRVLGEKGVGVVCGQVEDVQGEGAGSRERGAGVDVDYVYEHKTSDLFIAAALMGGYAADATPDEIAALHDFALNLGLAFQYEDDLLDGDYSLTREETERRVRETTAAATSALARLRGDTSFLRTLSEKLIGRSI